MIPKCINIIVNCTIVDLETLGVEGYCIDMCRSNNCGKNDSLDSGQRMGRSKGRVFFHDKGHPGEGRFKFDCVAPLSNHSTCWRSPIYLLAYLKPSTIKIILQQAHKSYRSNLHGQISRMVKWFLQLLVENMSPCFRGSNV